MIFVVTTTGFNLNAQNVHQLESLLQSNSESLVTSSDYLKKLTHDLVPSVYLNQGELKVDSETGTPIRVVTDVKSIERLYETNTLFDNVVMIIVQVNDESDLNKVLKAGSLNHFSDLKYIYVSCSFEFCQDSSEREACEKNKIKSILDGELSTPTTIVYTANQSE